MDAAFFKREFYRTNYFYHWLEIHKDQNTPLGHPIMATMESITSWFSLYIDQFLQPLAQSLPFYIRDGIYLFETLKTYTWNPSYLWVSLYLNSLYTLSLNDIGLRGVQHFLAGDPLLDPRQNNFILEATQFCLKHNYFEFDGDYFQQINGTVMGANVVTSYTHLTLGLGESKSIWCSNPFVAPQN